MLEIVLRVQGSTVQSSTVREEGGRVFGAIITTHPIFLRTPLNSILDTWASAPHCRKEEEKEEEEEEKRAGEW